MEPALLALAEQIAALAEARGQPDVAGLARSFARPDRTRRIALLPLLDAEAVPLIDWVAQNAPGVVVADGPSETGLLRTADHLLVAFPCGGLPDSDVLRALESGPHARPEGTSSLVFINAEAIASAADLDHVEATARRWFLSAGQGDSASTRLEDSGAYLWSQSPPADRDLAARLRLDAESLRRRIVGPPHPRALARLDRDRLALLLEEVEAGLDPGLAAGSDPRAFSLATDALEGVRGRILNRVRSDGEAFERAVRVAASALEGVLAEGLAPCLDCQSFAGRDLHAALGRYLDEVCDRGIRDARSAASQWARSLDDLAWVVREADWGPIRPRLGGDPTLPLLGRIDQARTTPPDLFDPTLHASAPNDPSSPRLLKSIKVGVLMGPMAAGLTRLAGFGPPGMAVVGGLATAVGMGIGYKSSRDTDRHQAMEIGQLAVDRLASEASVKLVRWASETIDHLHSGLAEELDALRTRLAGGIAPSRRPPLDASALSALRAQLDEFDPLPYRAV